MTDVPAELLTASSGSAGNVVHSHNQHARYVKPRVTPADPGTPLQVSIRSHLATCCLAWNNTLTQPERDTWERYALAVRLSGRLGRRTHAGGVAMYVRSNVPRLQAAEVTLPRVDVAPALQDLGSPSPLQRVVLNLVDDTLIVFFDIADAWRRDPGSALLFYASAPQALTRHFWTGPYRYAGPILGRSFPPPSSPSTIPLPYGYSPGHRCFIRYRLTSSDGRLSASRRLPADHLPQVAPICTAVTPTFIFPTLSLLLDFDHLLSGFALSTATWTLQFLGYLWTLSSARVYGSQILILARRGLFNGNPDTITYAPPPADVIALLTSIPAASFTRPIPFP